MIISKKEYVTLLGEVKILGEDILNFADLGDVAVHVENLI